MDNLLNARIKLKYDSYANWTRSIDGTPFWSTFTPLRGEVCIFDIPSATTAIGMTPPAVGIKVGNGEDTLQDLPWIQAMAGDVYAWAKAATKPGYTANEISSTRNDTINGNEVTTEPTVQQWLQDLTDDIASLSGGTAGSVSSQINSALAGLDVTNNGTDPHNITGFSSAKTLATLIETNGYISATFQDILIAQSQVSGLTDALNSKAPKNSPALTGTPTAPTAASGTNTTQIATTAFVKNAVDIATAGLAGAMHFKGKSTIDLSLDVNISENPSINGYDWSTRQAGDVVLNSTGAKEFVWNGTQWIELGDEVSFAVKGSITNADIASDAAIDQSKIANLTNDLNSKAPKASPTFTGTVTVPTPTNNTDAATKGYVDSTAAAANTTYSFASGDANGEIKITPSTNGTAGTAISIKPKNLKQIATSGSIYDIEEGSNTTTTGSVKYLILDCGSATALID